MKSRSQTRKDKFCQTSKMQFIKKGLISISILAFIVGCTKSTTDKGSSDNSIDCSGPAKTFLTDVKPIVQSFCSGCHGAGSTNGPGELITYSQIFNARADIRSAVISGAMPQNGRLNTAQKSSIICWIDNGALNN